MLVKKNDKSYVDMVPGVRRKTLGVGEKGLLTEFVLEQGAVLPDHSHPHEQLGYMVSGEMVFTIDGKEYPALPGDSWAIPGNAVHSAKVIKNSVVVEVFVPVREDYRG